ncbi:DUF1697 domain-containing protein [Gordonia sp. VNQ95]|uniref:DUF1697 domain-containing protein n=1 Tax=Gordonia sp. VNQ95 TaxID=3156619 RepID=UPI0032B34537
MASLPHIFLVRAINVGGAKLPMADLRSEATELGATEVRTHIASGNLICIPPTSPAAFASALEELIEARHGFSREVIARSVDELRNAVAAFPFEADDEKFAHLYFLTGIPDPDKTKAFLDTDFGDDQLAVIGADLHIYYAGGVGKSTLSSPKIARGLGVAGTGRNLRTVRTLIEIAEGTT